MNLQGITAGLLDSGVMGPGEEERRQAGLCAGCAHVQVIANDRGSRFYLCRRGLTDPSFRKYPVLPVWRCRGYEEAGGSGRSEEK